MARPWDIPYDANAPPSLALWAKARPHPKNASTMIPQAVAHRGYSAAYPENTMSAFRGAIEEAGAHALETDVHLSKDGVVVLAHDIDLQRCFGRPEKVSDLNFSELQELNTIKAPHVPIPSLQELLEYLAEPEHSEIWLILDIKLHDDAQALFQAIANILCYIPSPHNPWSRRIFLGCWKPTYMEIAREYLPTLPLAHISLTPTYALSAILPSAPHTALNLLCTSLVGLSQAAKNELADTAVFAWTVNDRAWMRWCVENASLVGQKLGGVDAVVTDDPKLFNEIAVMAGEDKDEMARVAPEVDFGRLFKAWLVKMLMRVASRGMRVVGWYGKVTVKTEQQKGEKQE